MKPYIRDEKFALTEESNKQKEAGNKWVVRDMKRYLDIQILTDGNLTDEARHVRGGCLNACKDSCTHLVCLNSMAALAMQIPSH